MGDESGSNPRPEEAPHSISLSQEAEPPALDRNTHILLIEDSASDITLIRSMLRQQKFTGEISIIRDGEKAIRFAEDIDSRPESAVPGLVILDLNLPRKHGHEVLRRFRVGRMANLPVVILTSSNDEKDKLMAAELGATKYIKKPTNLKEFMEIGGIIERVLRGDAPQGGGRL